MSVHIPSEFEVRTFADLRVDASEDKTLRGHAIVFNTRSVNLGWFYEVIKPEAVDRTLNEALDVRALVDHDSAKVLGRTTAGTLRLAKDRTGLKVAIDPPNTSYGKDIVESVGRGDVTGMSFRFRVMPDGDEWEELPDGTLLRHVTDMTVDEVSIVTFPAYAETDINVAKRSFEAFRQARGHHSMAMRRRWLQTVGG